MSATAAVLAGRRAIERLMVDACTITHPGAPTTDQETAGVTYPGATTVYTGKCRVSLKIKNARPNSVGQAQLWLIRLEVQLPMTATGVNIDDKLTMTASALDPDLPGRVFYVRELAHASHVTARRIQCVEVTG